MSNTSALLAPLHVPQTVSTAITSPFSADANNVNYVLPQRSSLRDPERVTPPAAPQTTAPQPATNTTKNITPAPSAQTVNLAPLQPLTPATHAAITQATTPDDITDTNTVSATASSAPAPSAIPAPTFAASSTKHVANAPITISSAQDQDLNDAVQTTSTNATTAAQTEPVATPPTAPLQGNAVQAGVYSSVESSTASTIRGSGVNVLS